MHVVPIAAVPYSGTAFIRAFLKPFPVLRHYVPLETVAERVMENVFHNLSPITGNLLVGHIHPSTLWVLDEISYWWTIIVPLRDPLATLVSAKARAPGEDHTAVLDTWRLLVDHVDRLGPHYVPLDLLNATEARSEALEKLVHAAGLAGTLAAVAAVSSWSKHWPKDQHGALPSYPLKVAMFNRDRAYIQRAMPAEWEALVRAEDWLRPFCVERGYTDCLWYNEEPGAEPAPEAA